MRRPLIVAVVTVAAVFAFAAPAFAHVTIDPASVPKGSTVKLSFLVPNEEASKTTTKVEIDFPEAPNAIPGVSVEAKPGWRFQLKTKKLDTPIETDDGSISEVVSSITWTAVGAQNSIHAEEFGSFTIDADGIPEDADQLVFKAVQTYSDGSEVKWVDPVSADGPEAEHPTPILKLTDAAGEATPTTAKDAPATTTTVATSTKDNSARALALVAMVLGAAALLFGTSALMKSRRKA